jgi:hypothetical protein
MPFHVGPARGETIDELRVHRVEIAHEELWSDPEAVQRVGAAVRRDDERCMRNGLGVALDELSCGDDRGNPCHERSSRVLTNGVRPGTTKARRRLLLARRLPRCVDSLRWHDPDQVRRVCGITFPHSQRSSAPLSLLGL